MKAVENCISVLDMPFNNSKLKTKSSKDIKINNNSKFKIRISNLLITIVLFALCSFLSAGIKDHVVAFVDDTAITLSELNEVYSESIKLNPEITKEEVLNSMINRILLLREAKKLRLNAPSEDELIKEYISLRMKPHVKEEEVSDFYQKHIDDFKGKEFETVREEIEDYLTERQLNQLLKEHIDELRKKAYIKIQLE